MDKLNLPVFKVFVLFSFMLPFFMLSLKALDKGIVG